VIAAAERPHDPLASDHDRLPFLRVGRPASPAPLVVGVDHCTASREVVRRMSVVLPAPGRPATRTTALSGKVRRTPEVSSLPISGP
jgi:hypothetical protein